MTDNLLFSAQQTPAGRRLSSAVPLWLMVILVSFASVAAKRGPVRPWLVRSVNFTGNASIASSELLGMMDTKPSRLFHKIKFSPSLLNADIDAIAYLYRDRGFLDIQVNDSGIVRDRSSRRVTVNIVIREGPQTRIDSVAIRGHTVFGEAEIKRFIQVKPHEPYSTTGLSYDQQTILDSAAARGYPLCAVERTDSVDSIAHKATVAFLIDQGPLAMAGPLKVNGAKRLRQVIVKRGMTFRQGDTLTTRRIQRSVRQLYETGMFKYVQIATPIADSAQQRKMAGPVSLPVLITIEEADFYKFKGGVGYGTYEGVRLSLQTSYGNMLGMGRTIGFDGKYSRLIQSLHLHYTAPWFFLLPPTAEAEVYGEHHNEVTFTGYLEGLTLSLFAKTPWNFGYRVFTTFEWVHDVVEQSPLTPMTHGNNTQSFGAGVTYDLRDNIFDPTAGLLVTSDAEIAGLIGAKTNHFYKFMMDARGYFPVAHFLNAATAVTAGYVNGYGVDKDVVPPQELFYTGSESIRPVRGYAPGGVGDAVGGRLVLVLNVLELRFALAKWLKIAGFADAGFVWTSTSSFDVHDLRWTAGPGIRIRSPVGLLSTDLGVRLNGPTMGKIGFSVSIGEPF
ncbi:MAG: BamA/TamA family outer membrane protein [Chitinispirillaceae bacterium]|nr:BamA/TamA family outer membrane protein [Chitinispirillaceae bacterium]